MKLFDAAELMEKREPDRVLFSESGHEYTARDVMRISGQVYGYLKQQNIGREDIVMIHMHRSSAIAFVFYGILKAGACAAIIDGDASESAYSYFEQDLNPSLILDEQSYQQILSLPPLAGREEPDAHDAAFIIYTSSTIGNPKGCIHEYGDLDLALRYYDDPNKLELAENERIALTTEFYDITTVVQLIQVLYTGCFIYVLSRDAAHDIRLYTDSIRKNRLTSVTLMQRFSDLALLSSLPSLQYIQFGFEIIENAYTDKLPIYNTYGMSESILSPAFFLIDRQYDITPVGKAIALRQTRLVNAEDRDVAPGEIGEVAFPNPYFRGYLNKPDETKAAMRNGIYHTGDMGYINEDGNLVLVGRKEDILQTEQGPVIPVFVQSAIKKIYPEKPVYVFAFEYQASPRVVVFYSSGTKPDPAAIKRELSKKLPAYMLPTDYVYLKEFPLTTAGKLNRAIMKQIFFDGSEENE